MRLKSYLSQALCIKIKNTENRIVLLLREKMNDALNKYAD